MANLIKLKRSATSGNNPTTANLELGELAINTFDGNLFFKKSVSGTESILSVATLTGTQTLTNKTLSSAVLTGTLTAGGGVGTNGQVLISTGSGVQWVNASNTTAPFNVLNDISNQFDGYKNVFNLLQDQTNITTGSISSSINLEVILNGKKLTPYIKQISFPWINTYESQKGYRVVVTSTDAAVTIYNTPDPGDQATLTIINSITTVPTTKYPYSATTIALGD